MVRCWGGAATLRQLAGGSNAPLRRAPSRQSPRRMTERGISTEGCPVMGNAIIAASTSKSSGSGYIFLVAIVALFGLLYFVTIRPQRNRHGGGRPRGRPGGCPGGKCPLPEAGNHGRGARPQPYGS